MQNKKITPGNKQKSVGAIIIIALALIIIACLIIFALTRKPKITYEYYINNNQSNIAGLNITSYECNNGTILNIDKDNNTYTIESATKNSLCKLYYEDTAGEQLMNLASIDTLQEENKTYIDENGVLRYYGENALNYIYFNCDNDSDTSTCETWRIVSVSKVSDVTKKNKYNLKIVKDTPLTAKNITTNQDITEFEWNNNRGFNYLESSIYNLLNDAYYNASSNYSYTNKNNETINLDFSKTGLKNDKVRNAVSYGTWRINANTDNNQTISNWYSDTAYGNMANFNIGLISISDYILSLKDECNNIKINAFGTCEAKSYLSKENGFFVSDSYQEKDGYVYRIAGNNAINAIYPTAQYNIYPTLYLNEDVKIISGDGSASNPYHLG